MKPRKHCLFASEGLELALAIALVVFPTWLSFAATPMPVIIAVSLVHVMQVIEGVNNSASRHMLVYTAAFIDSIGIVSEIYDNWSSLSTAGAEPERTTRALYILAALVMLLIINVVRWTTLDSENAGDHDEDQGETVTYRLTSAGRTKRVSNFNHLAAMKRATANSTGE